jgi:hypothetical protein
MVFSLRTVVCRFAAAAVLTTILSAIDVLLTGEQLTLGEIATDYLEMLLLSGEMVASAVVVQQLRDRESDSTAIRAELNKTSLAGKQWRPETNPCVTQKLALVSASPQRTDKHIFGAECGSVAT